MVLAGIVVFGIAFVIVVCASVVACYESFYNGGLKRLIRAAFFGVLLVLTIGSSLSYWFWNAGIEQSARGGVQIVTDAEDSHVKEVRLRTQWSFKLGFLPEYKGVFRTGTTELDISCTDNKNDDAVPVVCVRWAVDIDSTKEAQELVDSILGLNYSAFGKNAVEDRIKDIAEESYLECEQENAENKTSDCMLSYSSENIGLTNVSIVDVSEI